jgi:hypothetical protein
MLDMGFGCCSLYLNAAVSQSFLTRHYLAPTQSMKDDVLQALEKLQQQL